MSRITPIRVTVFVCVMAGIALFIHGLQVYQERHTAAVVARRQRLLPPDAAARGPMQPAAAEHAQYLARYLNAGFARKPGSKSVAVVVASESGTLNPAVTTALVNRFKPEAVEIVPALFKPAFVTDGLFQEAFSGSREPLVKLDLKNSLDGVVLARQDVHYAQSSSHQNVITATMLVKVAVVPVAGSGVSKIWTFTGNGPGFTREAARQTAEERLIGQITADTSMSLKAITSNH